MRTLTALALGASALTSMIAFAPADGDTGGAAAAPAVETKVILKQNGIKRPDAGTATGKLWDIADEISETKGAPALRGEVVKRYMAEQANANQATANTQYARWTVYHGVADLIKAQRKTESDAAKAAKDKEKADAKAASDAKKAEEKAAAEKAAADKKAADEAKAAEAAAAKQKKIDDAAAAKQKKIDDAAAAKAAKAA